MTAPYRQSVARGSAIEESIEVWQQRFEDEDTEVVWQTLYGLLRQAGHHDRARKILRRAVTRGHEQALVPLLEDYGKQLTQADERRAGDSALPEVLAAFADAVVLERPLLAAELHERSVEHASHADELDIDGLLTTQLALIAHGKLDDAQASRARSDRALETRNELILSDTLGGWDCAERTRLADRLQTHAPEVYRQLAPLPSQSEGGTSPRSCRTRTQRPSPSSSRSCSSPWPSTR